MKDKNLWVGYLTLAAKEILVASDDRVDTGNHKTLFLYNRERNEIVEYSREIIEAKLMDAPIEDYNAKEIAAAYQQALRKAKPNLYRVVFTPNAGGSSIPKEKKPAVAVASDDDEGMGDDGDIDDSFTLGDDDANDDVGDEPLRDD